MTSNMGDDSINSGNISTQQYAPVADTRGDKEEEKKKKKKKESNNALSENDLEFNVEDERSNARLMGASTMSSSSNATTEASEGTEGAHDEPPIKRGVALSVRRVSHVYSHAHRVSRNHFVHSHSRGNE